MVRRRGLELHLLGFRPSDSPLVGRVSTPSNVVPTPSGFDASPSPTAILTTPVALPATTIITVDGLLTPQLNHEPLAPPSSLWATPPSVEPRVSEPPPLDSKVPSPSQPPPSIAAVMIGLDASVHHSPTSVSIFSIAPVPSLVGRVPSLPPPRARVSPTQQPMTPAPSPTPSITSLQPSVSWTPSPALPTIETTLAKPPTSEIFNR
ncbi:UNVERIFIED_CONTAM: hypothetical protein Sangu_0228900 [Sesamum angustifolium]|uniref:Uncharacterized protein n=1 Tax=Sesamum angustifolium TaxID=2727405 RepID=A0AAW2RQL2_9LAMI